MCTSGEWGYSLLYTASAQVIFHRDALLSESRGNMYFFFMHDLVKGHLNFFLNFNYLTIYLFAVDFNFKKGKNTMEKQTNKRFVQCLEKVL